MAEFHSLDEFRKKKQDEVKKDTREYSQQIFQQIVDKVLIDWEDAWFKNNIDQYLSKRLGITKKKVFDLNSISNVEKALGMEIALFYPNALPQNKNGFIAGFNHKKFAMATPEMASEAEARVLNILLFLELRDVEKQGII